MDKVIDPGNEPSNPRTSVENLMAFIERNPHCTLAGGEGFKLVERIRALERDIKLWEREERERLDDARSRDE